MSVLTLRRTLLEQLDGPFRGHGFTRWSDPSHFYGDRYDRWQNEFRQSVNPAITVCRNRLEFGVPYISIRLNSVEELVARFEDRLQDDDTSIRATIGFRAEWDSLLSALQTAKVLKNEQDVIKEARKFVPWVIRKGEPFWVRFSDPQEVLKILTGEGQESDEFAAGPSGPKTERAIALAIILNGPNDARKLAEAKIQMLKAKGSLKTANEVQRWADRAFAAVK